MTLEEAKKAIQQQLKILKDPHVEITVAQGRGIQQIRGEHLVRPDGRLVWAVMGVSGFPV